jgi:hypothetical protein
MPARIPAGEDEKSRLQDLICEAHAIPSLLGSAFLLVDELKPHSPALEKVMRRSDGGSGDSYYFPNAETAGGGFENTCDFGHLDFSCFDAGALDSFDAGFSDAGGDGDGDGGGGGDGGSSGC